MVVTTKFERITPSKAEAYLKKNESNRPLKDSLVRRLMHALRGGHWRETHQGIAFNGDGRLLDGQHRLTAIVRTGISAQLMVARGLSDDAFLAIDTGGIRSPADHLSLRGYVNTNVMARVLHLQFLYEANNGDIETRLSPDRAPDKDDLMAVADAHPDLVRICQSRRSDLRIIRDLATPATWAFLSYQFSRRDPALADEFMDAMMTGANLKEDSVVLLTRNRCLAISGEVRARKRPVTEANNEKASLIVRAWNRVRDGKEHGSTKVQSRRISTEFPAIR